MNQFKLLLLNIVGTTCLNIIFYIAFCFLAKEEENDYVWALEQLKSICMDSALPGVMVMD
jgi:MULE transposase domain